ncbi:MAG: ferrochelatase, partial [Alphaproteobacteria bacterium]
MAKIAIVLFNLGGPDSLQAVQPFLQNLFSDPAIISIPAPFRQILARVISKGRAKTSSVNYAMLGGASPLLKETEGQAAALAAALAKRRKGDEVRTFIAMRYWHPLTEDAAKEVAAFAPDEIILLPLYPQYSTTTTRSSVKAWRKAYKGPGRTREVCCYPAEASFVKAHADLVAAALKAHRQRPMRVLFSAHGLPEKIIASGDPYQKQVEATAAAVVAALGGKVDHAVCYQSRVGPLKWIGPSTVEAIQSAVNEGKGVIVCPIAFVSEHVETLVELDHDYKDQADAMGCVNYHRIPTLSLDAMFTASLADLVEGALSSDAAVAPGA